MKTILQVELLADYKLLLTFENNEKRIKDMKPYLDKGVFKKLKNQEVFNNVKVELGTITWGEEIDMCADNLYETSKAI